MISPQVVTEPTVEPITVAEVKTHLRITHSTEDTLLGTFITSARSQFESLTGRTIHQTTLRIAFDRFPGGSDYYIELPRASPLISVTSVVYLDKDGVSNTWGASNYIVDTLEDVGRIAPAHGIAYPSFTPYPLNAVRILYVAGIANGSPQTVADQSIRVAIQEMVGSLYLNREHVILGDNRALFITNPVVAWLIDKCKVKRAF